MKFRCERDVLVEALGTAGRATASRGGALPVLAGIRTELAGDALTLTGHDLELTISVDDPRGRERQRGRRGGAAVAAGVRRREVVAERGGRGRGRRRAGAHHGAALRVHACACSPSTSSPACPSPSADGVTLDAAELAAALRQVVPAASGDDARPILTGVLVTAEADGLRLVATDSYRLAVRDLPGQSVLAEGQSVLVPSRALNDLTKVLGGVERADPAPRRARRQLRGRLDVRLTTMLIEGDFPNYKGLIPSAHPNRLTVEPRGAARGRAPGEAAGPRGHAGAAGHVERRARPRGGDTGRRPGARVARRQVRGRRAHRGVQPRLPAAGHRGAAGRRGAASRPSTR